MGMTMTQKILADHAGLESVVAGQLISAKLDIVLGNDITTPVAINEFKKAGFEKVFDKDKIAVVLDHFVPNKDIKSAQQSKQCREFACANCVSHFYDVGKMGIEHALLPEQGVVTAGDCIIGADSHTCTYGALGAFSTGIGSTDMACAMATGKIWLRVPEAIKVELTGSFNPHVGGKDLILHLIGMIGVDGARYQSLEFTGPGIAALTMDDRFTVANMAIEAGAKNGIFPVDETCLAYLRGHGAKAPVAHEADENAEYVRTIGIDLSELKPTVAFPHLPENTREIDSVGDIKIDQVVIGSCTNGRLSDLKAAFEIIKGKKGAPGELRGFFTGKKTGKIVKNTLSGVVYQKNAFECVTNGSINNTPNSECIRAAREALNGWDPTGGCLYFYNAATVSRNSWIHTRTVRTVIGRHSFAV